MRLTLKSPPAELPLSLADAKKHCVVEPDDDEDDSLLEGFIAAAVDLLDGPSGILGRAIVNQTWLLELASWPRDLRLPLEPVQEVSISYIDPDGEEQALSSDAWDLTQYPSRPSQLSLTKGNLPPLGSVSYPVQISINVGFGSAEDVPKALKVAIQIMVSDWYERRGEIQLSDLGQSLPPAVSMLISRWRVVL